MGDPSLAVTMERFDAHAARWRLRCHRQAAERLLAGWTGRRVAPLPTAEPRNAPGGR
jgi:hypothetical protein